MSSFSLELFEELRCKYYSKIYWYFRREFDDHTAEDLCQQTYMNAWRYISGFANADVRQNKAWLFTVARNVKNDHLRYVKLHNMDFHYKDLYEADTLVDSRLEECIDVRKALEMLTEEERQLISMSQYLTSREIGSVLGISGSAVRNRLQKAKQILKKILEDSDINV